jgi:hypothetical protein
VRCWTPPRVRSSTVPPARQHHGRGTGSFRTAYGLAITKDDVFFYVYGLLSCRITGPSSRPTRRQLLHTPLRDDRSSAAHGRNRAGVCQEAETASPPEIVLVDLRVSVANRQPR